MSLKDIVSVSGLSGLYKVVVQRQDGLVITPLGENKNRFVSNRNHVFTPLDGITVYTETDSEELSAVLQKMKAKKDELPPPNHKKASNDELNTYFNEILPEYDRERVYTSDIKKIIKWYKQLDEHNHIDLEQQDDREQQDESSDSDQSTSSKNDNEEQ